MPDWNKSMTQTFEYYEVDPGTWKDKKRITTIKSSSITRDSEAETLGSATIDATELLGEGYIRIYLVTIQNGITERFPLGTYMVQTPSSSFDGKIRTVSMDAYTPLIELKENPPPLGYSLLEGDNILERAYMLVRENMRGPVVKSVSNDTLSSDFVANTDDTWSSFIIDLLANAKHILTLDELGRTLFSPKQDIESLQPIVTFSDDNSSILHPSITMDNDLYGIPNVVEVTYSGEHDTYYSKVVNDDPNSPTSTVSRGRIITKRVTNPEIAGEPMQWMIDDYAERLLSELSSIDCSIQFTHGYYPVRLGDCIRLNYERAKINNVKAKVVNQTIKCEPGCPVTTKAVFKNKLWR